MAEQAGASRRTAGRLHIWPSPPHRADKVRSPHMERKPVQSAFESRVYYIIMLASVRKIQEGVAANVRYGLHQPDAECRRLCEVLWRLRSQIDLILTKGWF